MPTTLAVGGVSTAVMPQPPRPVLLSTAFTMLWYPVQRQRLPSSPSRTSVSVGDGFSASSEVAAITMPGVQ